MVKAYKSNPILTGARASQRALDEEVNIVKADGRPGADIDTQYREQLHRANPDFTPRRTVSSAATLSVPIYLGGQVRNGIKAAKWRVQAGQNDLRATEASVFSSVVAAYMDVIRDQAILELNRQNVEALSVNREATSDRYEAGDLTVTDVTQSEARLALARASLEDAQARLIASKEQYVYLIGSPPMDLTYPPPLANLPENPEIAVATALEDNPDILAAQKAVRAARYDVKAAKGQIAPRLSAFATGSYVDYLNSEEAISDNLGRPLDGSEKEAVVGARLIFPLYQGGRPAAQARRAVALQSEAIERHIAIERDVIAQTRSAYASWRASLLSIQSTRKAAEAASLALEGVKAESSVGTRTILDVLDTQRDLLNAQVEYVAAQRDAYVAAFSLLAAMGRADAPDLGLAVGSYYDPADNYDRVNHKIFDFDFDPYAEPVANKTADTPTQTIEPVATIPLP